MRHCNYVIFKTGIIRVPPIGSCSDLSASVCHGGQGESLVPPHTRGTVSDSQTVRLSDSQTLRLCISG